MNLTLSLSVLRSKEDRPGRQTEERVLPNRWRSTTALQERSGSKGLIPKRKAKAGQCFLPCSTEQEKRTALPDAAFWEGKEKEIEQRTLCSCRKIQSTLFSTKLIMLGERF